MTTDDKRQHQRPEGVLLERAMKGPPKVSGRQLAKLADMSEGRVRQILNGYKSEAGMVLPVTAPAETLARLGAALDVDPAEFDRAGRADAGDILRGDITSGVTEEGDLWLSDLNEHRIALLDWLNAGDESAPPPRGALMLWEMPALLDAVARKHRDETHFLNNLLSLARAQRSRGGDGHADDDARGAAPIGAIPDLAEAAHDEEHTIEEEQEGDEFP